MHEGPEERWYGVDEDTDSIAHLKARYLVNRGSIFLTHIAPYIQDS